MGAVVLSFYANSLPRQIVDHVRSLGGAARYGQIRWCFPDKEHSVVANAVARLVARRAIIRHRRGVYALPGFDPSVVDLGEVRRRDRAAPRRSLHVVPREPKAELDESTPQPELAEDHEIARWANEVAALVRGGMRLRDALAEAKRSERALAEAAEDVPVGVEASQ